MKKQNIDESKLPQAMELIERAAALMAERDCRQDPEAKEQLAQLEQDLRRLTGNRELDIRQFQRYWSYMDLDTAARKALMAPPQKERLSDQQIREIVLNIMSQDEEEMDWQLQYLELNTGLDNLTDYIFYPESVGLELPEDLPMPEFLAQVAEQIIRDRK